MSNIYEVADRSGVSIATVSRFLNSPGKVASATRQKIQKAIEDLDFIPSREAALRARQNLKRIGIMIPGLAHSSFMERIRGVASALPPSEYDLIIYPVENRMQLDSYLDMLPSAKRIDGLILMSLPFSESCAAAFARSCIPVVSVERDLSHFNISSVVVSNFRGGQMAAGYLLGRGYCNPAFLGHGGYQGYSFSAAGERLRGFRDELAGRQHPRGDDKYFQLHYNGIQKTREIVREMLSFDDPPDCIFTATDKEAMITMQVVRERGGRMPEDIGVFGFDYTEFAGIMGITTIDQKLSESGREAARLLLMHMKQAELSARKLTLTLEIRPGKTA